LVDQAQVNQIAEVVFTILEFGMLDLATLKLTDYLIQSSQEDFFVDAALFGQAFYEEAVGAVKVAHAGDKIFLHSVPFQV
jgi:hypothetical protein